MDKMNSSTHTLILENDEPIIQGNAVLLQNIASKRIVIVIWGMVRISPRISERLLAVFTYEDIYLRFSLCLWVFNLLHTDHLSKINNLYKINQKIWRINKHKHRNDWLSKLIRIKVWLLW